MKTNAQHDTTQHTTHNTTHHRPQTTHHPPHTTYYTPHATRHTPHNIQYTTHNTHTTQHTHNTHTHTHCTRRTTGCQVDVVWAGAMFTPETMQWPRDDAEASDARRRLESRPELALVASLRRERQGHPAIARTPGAEHENRPAWPRLVCMKLPSSPKLLQSGVLAHAGSDRRRRGIPSASRFLCHHPNCKRYFSRT